MPTSHRLNDTSALHLRSRPPPNPIMLLTFRHQMIHIPRIHQPRSRLLHIRDPHQPHTRLQLILQNPTQMLHALLPIAQTIQKRPPDPHGRGPERQRLEHIRPPRDAAVDKDFAPAENIRAEAMEFQQGEQRRLRRVEGAAAMVRNHDTLDAVREGLLRVGGALDPLDDDGEAAGRVADPGDVVPAEGLVNVLAH